MMMMAMECAMSIVIRDYLSVYSALFVWFARIVAIVMWVHSRTLNCLINFP